MLISSQQLSVPQGIHSQLTLILNLSEMQKIVVYIVVFVRELVGPLQRMLYNLKCSSI